MSGPEVIALIGLGSNLDDPIAQVRSALVALSTALETRLISQSSLYRSAPIGPAGQPDYVNAVAMVATTLAPLALLDTLQAIEQAHGRVRAQHWGPRTLDLDLLLYGNQQINDARLVVPHPEMHKRAFVLVPLSEISPTALLPGVGRVAALLRQVETSELSRIDDQGD